MDLPLKMLDLLSGTVARIDGRLEGEGSHEVYIYNEQVRFNGFLCYVMLCLRCACAVSMLFSCRFHAVFMLFCTVYAQSAGLYAKRDGDSC